ncbi:MAG: succinate dehydrogenase assembly factor 2 [Hyphomicrobiales bacterium]|nr:succinate dehydrogenase assembly factor 2 [Hyphomicrobiales bacterium]
MTEDRDADRRKRLRFRAWHRVMKEMDFILGSFADSYLARMSAAEIDAFERLIEMPDADLLSWISGSGDPPDPDLTGLVERLRAVTLQPEDYR